MVRCGGSVAWAHADPWLGYLRAKQSTMETNRLNPDEIAEIEQMGRTCRTACEQLRQIARDNEIIAAKITQAFDHAGSSETMEKLDYLYSVVTDPKAANPATQATLIRNTYRAFSRKYFTNPSDSYRGQADKVFKQAARTELGKVY